MAPALSLRRVVAARTLRAAGMRALRYETLNSINAFWVSLSSTRGLVYAVQKTLGSHLDLVTIPMVSRRMSCHQKLVTARLPLSKTIRASEVSNLPVFRRRITIILSAMLQKWQLLRLRSRLEMLLRLHVKCPHQRVLLLPNAHPKPPLRPQVPSMTTTKQRRMQKVLLAVDMTLPTGEE